VRIVSQLIDVESDRHLWSETYDRELTDIFAIQSDVALQIATALEAELSHEERREIRKEPTADVEAYQLYLQGQHCIHRWTGEGVKLGLAYLEDAVGRDPAYALAHAALAKAYTDIGLGVVGELPPEEAFARAKLATARALELDPRLAEAHAALGHLKYVCDYDWAGAEAELKLAIELNPNSGDVYDVYGLLLSAVQEENPIFYLEPKALLRIKGDEPIPGEPSDDRQLSKMIDAPLGDRTQWKPQWPQLEK
jgi:serine/threonine-protein kinase